MPLIPMPGRQRQVDFCKFETSLVYRVSSRTASTVSQRKQTNKQRIIPAESIALSVLGEAELCEFETSLV